MFNVHARSISPCDPHSGISVLFEYPACILDRADRIRLFGKLRADVASLAPPTSLHYITEQVKYSEMIFHRFTFLVLFFIIIYSYCTQLSEWFGVSMHCTLTVISSRRNMWNTALYT